MEHAAAKSASLFFFVLALAFAVPAAAQTVTSTPAASLSTTSSVASVSTTTSTTTKPAPKKRVRRKIVGHSPSNYRNPRGSLLTGIYFGIGQNAETGLSLFFGLSAGYAALTGVVPGVRGELLANDRGVGGEVAGTLTLTPPLTWDLTPFVIGELGYHGEGEGFSGYLYGVGGGFYLGDPSSRIALQIGWVWRRLIVDGADRDISGPILAAVFRF
jgi:hypothetical protein